MRGDHVTFRFRLTDAATGRPITGAKPAAWLAPRSAGEPREPAALARKIGALIQGDRLAPAELDLNQFYVLALNDDATITVVDPRLSFGGSRLLAMVTLPGIGEDWAVTADDSRLFVSVPSAGRVVAIDTGSWAIVGAVEDLSHPTRLVLQGDGHDLWVTTDTGVAVIDVDACRIRAAIKTGSGPHDIAVGRDDAQVYVTNQGSHTVSVIDGRRRARVTDVATGAAPCAIGYSTASASAYVLDAIDGTISVLAGDPPAVVRRVAVGRGARTLSLAPGGRLAIVANPSTNELVVIDTAVDRVIRSLATDGGADQITFSERMAYVRQTDSAMVRLIPLDALGATDRPATAIEIPGGRNPLGRVRVACLAPAIARAASDDAVLITNPADQTLYYYKEGLAAPMGSFRNYGHEPRAVLAVDRSLRPTSPGIYQTVARLPRPGRFDVAFYLDTPRLIHCFEVDIADDPRQPPPAPTIAVRPVDAEDPMVAGHRQRFSFRLETHESGEPVANRRDVRVLATLPARWQQMYQAAAVPGQRGAYAVEFTPPHAGLYCFYVECPSAGLSLRSPHAVYRQVKGTSQ